MRRSRFRGIDSSTTVNAADGPLSTVGNCIVWDSLEYVIANILIFALVLAILAVWAAPVDARPLEVRTHPEYSRDSGS